MTFVKILCKPSRYLYTTKYYAMKNYFSVLIFVLCITAFSACTTAKYVYTPATANLLLLEKKNDIKAAVNYVQAGTILGLNNGSRESHGADIQGAYAINDKIGVKVSAYTKKEYNEADFSYANDPKDMVNYKKNGIEISGGLYDFSGKKAKNRFHLFGGAGTGRFSFSENRFNGITRDLYHHNMSYLKLFLQPALILNATGRYTVTLSTVPSLVKYYNVRTNYTDLSDEPLGYIETKPSIFVDFVLQNEFSFNGLRGFSFQWQAGLTDLLTRFPTSPSSGFSNEKYDYNKGWLAVGIIANFNTLLSK